MCEYLEWCEDYLWGFCIHANPRSVQESHLNHLTYCLRYIHLMDEEVNGAQAAIPTGTCKPWFIILVQVLIPLMLLSAWNRRTHTYLLSLSEKKTAWTMVKASDILSHNMNTGRVYQLERYQLFFLCILQTLELARNPAMLQELMRSQDRAMSNLEVHLSVC